MSEAADRAWMERAIDLGSQARFWAAPNPAVGCVLVRDGEVIGSVTLEQMITAIARPEFGDGESKTYN